MKAVVAERGQVTIPKTLRNKLGIRPGTELEFSAKGGTLIARKAETDPVSRVFGCLGKRIDSDAFVRELRGNPAK
jgi:antitoxin PrlF